MAIAVGRRRVSRFALVATLISLGILGALAARDATAVEQTATLDASADTFVRQVARNANEGGSPILGVRALIDHHTLVQFDQSELESAVSGSTLQSATLRLTLVENSGWWGFNGRDIAVHRLNSAWAEGNGYQFEAPGGEWTRGNGAGATWNCAVDANIANIFKNCNGPAEWEINASAPSGPWQATASDTATVVTSQTGPVEWDVTADVQAWLDGSADNDGWIIRRTDSFGAGDARFASREAAAGGPQLILTFAAAPPDAIDDTYDADINSGLSVAAPGVLGNDLGSELTAVPQSDAPTANGGSVTVNADGSFSYDPPPGADNGSSDSFNYTAENAAGSDSDTVTLNLIDNGGLGTLWFIDNTATGPDYDGTFDDPFSSLGQFNASPLPEPGDAIFVYAGGGPYDGGIVLQDNQTLLGEGVGLEAGAISIPAGNRPTLTNTGGDGIALASGNSVSGLNVGDTTGVGLSGASVGGLTVAEVAVNGAGAAVDIANGDVVVTLDEASAADVDSGVTLANLTGAVTIADGTLTNNVNAITLNQVANVSLSNLTITGSTGDAILGAEVTGLNIENVVIDASGDAADEHGIDITDLLGTSQIVSTTISGAAGSNISIQNAVATGADALTLSGLDLNEPDGAFGRDNIFIGAVSSGNLAVSVDASVAPNALSGGQDGIEAVALSGGSLDVAVSGSGIVASAGVGVNLGALSGGTVSFNVSDNNSANSGGIAAAGGIGVNVTSFFGGVITGTVANNEIDDTALGDGVRVIVEGDGSAVVLVDGNTLTGDSSGHGIRGHARAGSGTLDLTITNNTVDGTGTLALDGIHVESGSSAGGDANTVCLNLANNTSGVTSGEEGYRLRQRSGTAFLLQDFTGDGSVAIDIEAWVTVDKANSGTTDIVIGTAFAAAPGACQTP